MRSQPSFSISLPDPSALFLPAASSPSPSRPRLRLSAALVPCSRPATSKPPTSINEEAFCLSNILAARKRARGQGALTTGRLRRNVSAQDVTEGAAMLLEGREEDVVKEEEEEEVEKDKRTW
ncbi:hypothetical protein GUITHDRAFT_149058 [Guillardia theta CCMP2712]|uniref:Uncharacterized protein n=1 Tax=Guillardia theta (strain CCMP2712) TaxID=905079 RepID=L1I7J2_GUITC|nr:hypothetical protein GUITHDRAFT_149058 [Guillardia theta CCMP2712]EKX31805.1 hypothetical protein GUITHDRAFT_149058 [Guillardia theta CCMP2712]|eukprot:XP_005818785.1 hypothetical protein GUITHDRAFT_149058 [Guillardia theta CCMP2712]